MTIKLASPKQMAWIVKLVDEKVLPHALRVEIQDALLAGTITGKDASRFLDALFAAPNHPVPGEVTEPGFYQHNNKVYRVKAAKAGHLYAQLITPAGFDYESAKGIMKVLKADMMMTVSQICDYGMNTHVCCNCSTKLSDPVSEHIGLGTSCGPKLLGKEAYKQARKNAEVTLAVSATKDALAGKPEGVLELQFS